MKKNVLALFSAPLFALAACSDEAASDGSGTAEEGEVVGDVLGGSISDDMLPLDQLTSQSPSAQEDPEGAASTTPSVSSRSSQSSGESTSAPSPEESTQSTETSTPAVAPAATPTPAQPIAPRPTSTVPTVAPPTDGDGQ